jgi:hypothetical protein
MYLASSFSVQIKHGIHPRFPRNISTNAQIPKETCKKKNLFPKLKRGLLNKYKDAKE